eukprot:gene7289-7360_t
MGLKDASLIQKLVMSFTVVLVCSAGASGLLLHLDGQAASMLDASQEANITMAHLSHAATAHLDQAHTMRGYLLTGVERHAKLYQSAVSLFHDEMIAAQSTPNIDADVKRSLEKVEAASASWRAQVGDPAVQKYKDKAVDEALAIAKAPKASELQQAFRDQLSAAEAKIQALSALRQQSIRSSLWLISTSQIIGGLVALVAAIVSGFWLYSSIGEPVKRMTKLMMELASGNIKINVPFTSRKDELGSMARTIQVFKDLEIKRLVLESEARDARLQSDATRASRETGKDAEALILRTASMALSEGLDQLVRGNLDYRIETAQGAKQAQDIVFGAQGDAKHSDAVVRRAIHAMKSSSLMALIKQFHFSAAAPKQAGIPKDLLRWELKKAVPHVFRQNRPVPSGTSANGEIKPLRAVVSGKTNSDDWQEF